MTETKSNKQLSPFQSSSSNNMNTMISTQRPIHHHRLLHDANDIHQHQNPPPLDGSLRTERTSENAPTNRVKHLALNKRHEMYKNIMADGSQVTDGRSLEMLRRNDSTDDLGLFFNLFGFGKDRNDGPDKLKPTRKSGGPSRRHSIDELSTIWHPDSYTAYMKPETSVSQRPRHLSNQFQRSLSGGDAQPSSRGRRGSSRRHSIDELSTSWHPDSYTASMKPETSVVGQRPRHLSASWQPDNGVTPLASHAEEPDANQRAHKSLRSNILNQYSPKNGQSRRPVEMDGAKDRNAKGGTTSSNSTLGSRRRSSEDSLSLEGFSESDPKAHRSRRKSSEVDQSRRKPSEDNLLNSSDASLLSSELCPKAHQSRRKSSEDNLLNSSEPSLLSTTSSCSSVSAARSRSQQQTKQSGGGEKGVTMRKKYRPRHRCLPNGQVAGIVKPPRYSQSPVPSTNGGNNATRRKSDEDAEQYKKEESSPAYRRRSTLSSPIDLVSLKNLISIHRPTTSTTDENNPESSYVNNDNSLHSRDLLNDTAHSRSNLLTDTSMHSYSSAQSWVPLGVEFSANMEVYVFEK